MLLQIAQQHLQSCSPYQSSANVYKGAPCPDFYRCHLTPTESEKLSLQLSPQALTCASSVTKNTWQASGKWHFVLRSRAAKRLQRLMCRPNRCSRWCSTHAHILKICMLGCSCTSSCSPAPTARRTIGRESCPCTLVLPQGWSTWQRSGVTHTAMLCAWHHGLAGGRRQAS